MHKFVRNLVTEWRRLKLPFSGAAVVVAVSGGADSVALLNALAELQTRRKLRLTVIVAHLNHGLRGAESDSDEEFVGELAARHGFRVSSARMKLSAHGNLEQNARRARYDFLAATAAAENAALIVTAHTMNDQAETLLMNLLRGSGVSGLAAMKPVSDAAISGELLLVRPLLSWAKREDTVAFCEENGHDFRIDRMNSDERFTRVKIRRKLLPALAEFNPKIVETLARTAFALQSSAPELEPVDAETLALAELRKLDQTALFGILRAWLKARRGNLRGLGLKHFDAIMRLINSTRSGRVAELPGGSVVKSNGALAYIAKDRIN